MAWQKQESFKSGNKVDKTNPQKKYYSQERPIRYEEIKPYNPEETNEPPSKHEKPTFIQDWIKCRDRHPGQTEVLKALFDDGCQYVFYRAGRKGAKTTTAIDAVWRQALEQPNRVIYLCYPTIAQGIEVVWEERRLQTCDQRDDWMFDKYVEKVDDSRHIVKFCNGSFVKLIGTWTEARGRGTQPDFLVFDEFQDCNPDYIEAMDANLAAKENSKCLIMGTPPKKRNQYEEWWERIKSHPKGKTFHYTSYDNIRLPHLKEWLDNKHVELVKAGKEDVWLREYMAELCYSSADRVIPDPKFMEKEEMLKSLSLFDYRERIPVLAVSVHPTYFCAILATLLPRKMVFMFDHMIIPQVWDKSLAEIYPLLGEKVKFIQDLCHKKIRQLVWDESGAFIDIVTGFTKCRKDIKWQDRGFPLLRELMVKEKIKFSRDVADFGVECQNMLIEETDREVQKNYPMVCTFAMMVNEYFSQEKLSIPQFKEFDKYQAFRDMGIPCPSKPKYNNFLRFSK